MKTHKNKIDFNKIKTSLMKKNNLYIVAGILAVCLLAILLKVTVGGKRVKNLENLETYSLSETGYVDLSAIDTQREKNISLGEVTISGKKVTLYLVSDESFVKSCSNGKENRTAIYMNNKYLQVSCDFDVINSVYKIDDDTIGITGVATASQEDKKYEPLTVAINSKGVKKEASKTKNVSIAVPEDNRITLSNFTTDDAKTNLTIIDTGVSIKNLTNQKGEDNNILTVAEKEYVLLKYEDEILLNLYVINDVVAVETSSVTHQDVPGATIMRFYKGSESIGELQSPGFFSQDGKISCLDPENDGTYTKYNIEITDKSVKKVKAN